MQSQCNLNQNPNGIFHRNKTNEPKICMDSQNIPKLKVFLGFLGGSEGKESACNEGDLGSIPGLRISPGGGNSNPFSILA